MGEFTGLVRTWLAQSVKRAFRGRRHRYVIEFPFPVGNFGVTGTQRADGYYAIRQTEYDIRLARQYTQTDGYGRELVELFVDSVVGTAGVRVLWGDAYVQRLWDDWRWNITRPYERVDEAQRDFVRSVIRDGESLMQVFGDTENIYLQNLDPIELPLETGDLAGLYGRGQPKGRIVQGIEFDEMGRPVAYHFRPLWGGGPARTLPASEVIHSYVEIFPGQVRGISWLRSSLEALRQLQTFERNFALMVDTAAKLPGYFTAPEELQMPFSEDELDDDDDLADLQQKWLDQNMNADPTTRPRLPAGTEWHNVEVSSAVNGQLYTATRKGLLARIARGMGVSYNSLAGDLGEANYSSLRMGQIENQAQYRRIQRLLLGWLERVAMEWLDYQRIRDSRVDRVAERLQPEYDAPSFDLIDPLKEAATGKMLVENRVRSRQQLIRESGANPDRVLEQIADEEAAIIRLRRERGLTDDGTAERQEETEDEDGEDGQTDDNPTDMVFHTNGRRKVQSGLRTR